MLTQGELIHSNFLSEFRSERKCSAFLDTFSSSAVESNSHHQLASLPFRVQGLLLFHPQWSRPLKHTGFQTSYLASKQFPICFFTKHKMKINVCKSNRTSPWTNRAGIRSLCVSFLHLSYLCQDSFWHLVYEPFKNWEIAWDKPRDHFLFFGASNTERWVSAERSIFRTVSNPGSVIKVPSSCAVAAVWCLSNGDRRASLKWINLAVRVINYLF